MFRCLPVSVVRLSLAKRLREPPALRVRQRWQRLHGRLDPPRQRVHPAIHIGRRRPAPLRQRLRGHVGLGHVSSLRRSGGPGRRSPRAARDSLEDCAPSSLSATKIRIRTRFQTYSAPLLENGAWHATKDRTSRRRELSNLPATQPASAKVWKAYVSESTPKLRPGRIQHRRPVPGTQPIPAARRQRHTRKQLGRDRQRQQHHTIRMHLHLLRCQRLQTGHRLDLKLTDTRRQHRPALLLGGHGPNHPPQTYGRVGRHPQMLAAAAILCGRGRWPVSAGKGPRSRPSLHRGGRARPARR